MVQVLTFNALFANCNFAIFAVNKFTVLMRTVALGGRGSHAKVIDEEFLSVFE